MIHFKKITLALTVSTLALTGCMGTKHLSQNISDEGRIADSQDIVFPELDKAWQKDGQFPNRENLSKIRAGVGKDELYQLIGRPHFSEAQKAREWDYIMKFYQADDSVKICQYKVIFDKDYKGQEFYWLPADCANYAKPATAQSSNAVTSVVGMGLHHDNFGLGADALFDFDKWQLSHMKAEGRTRLDEIATQISAHGDKLGQVVITGYTDPLGNAMYNINLSMLRAQTVREYLVSKGVNPAQIIATGGGKSMQVKECSSNQSHQSLINCLEPNRRVEVSVSYYR